MNNPPDNLSVEQPLNMNTTYLDFARCLRCGNFMGIQVEHTTSDGCGSLSFEKHNAEWWNLRQKFRLAQGDINVPQRFILCLQCGQLWGEVDINDAVTKVRNCGSERLHQKLGWLPLQET